VLFVWDCVLMMGRWSELVSVTVLHIVVFARFGEQKFMSGDVACLSAWCGMCVALCR
jgi:hypothetical protein